MGARRSSTSRRGGGAVALAGLVLGASGCSDGGDGSGSDCPPTSAEPFAPVYDFVEQWDSGLTCEGAEDCVLVSADIRCEEIGSFFGTCPRRAIHADSLEAFEAEYEVKEAEACELLPAGCGSSPVCLPVHAACVQGECRLIEGDGGIDASVGDAGAPDAATDGG